MKKRLDKAMGDTPEVKMYSIEELEKMFHCGPTCPTTGEPYKRIETRRFGKYHVICSECNQTIYSYRSKIRRLIN